MALAVLVWLLLPRRRWLLNVVFVAALGLPQVWHIVEVTLPRLPLLLSGAEASGAAVETVAGLTWWNETYVALVVVYAVIAVYRSGYSAEKIDLDKGCWTIVARSTEADGWDKILPAVMTANFDLAHAWIVIHGRVYGYRRDMFQEVGREKIPKRFRGYRLDPETARRRVATLTGSRWSLLSNCMTRIYLPGILRLR